MPRDEDSVYLFAVASQTIYYHCDISHLYSWLSSEANVATFSRYLYR